jgi:hypothetical protein
MVEYSIKQKKGASLKLTVQLTNQVPVAELKLTNQ